MNKPSTPAWERDDWWREVAHSIAGGGRLRSDSYLQALTEEDLEQLRLCLSSSLDYAAMRLAAPKWRGGKHDGNPPSESTLAGLWQASRQVEMLLNVERNNILVEATRKKAASLGLGADEVMLDNIMMVVAQEVLNQTVTREDPKNRTAAARLLLKRSDQKLDQRRMTLLEKKAAQADQAQKVTESDLTPEEKQLKLRQIFGMT